MTREEMIDEILLPVMTELSRVGYWHSGRNKP